MADFKKILMHTLQHEGGYNKDPHDPGGETYKGISRKYHPEWTGWAIIDRQQLLRNFPGSLESDATLQHLVENFYQTQFWEPLQGNTLKEDVVAASIFDFAVNAGIGTAVLLACITMGLPQSKIANDAWVAALNQQEPKYFLTHYFLAKTIRYHYLVQQKPDNRRYFYGWIQRALFYS